MPLGPQTIYTQREDDRRQHRPVRVFWAEHDDLLAPAPVWRSTRQSARVLGGSALERPDRLVHGAVYLEHILEAGQLEDGLYVGGQHG